MKRTKLFLVLISILSCLTEGGHGQTLNHNKMKKIFMKLTILLIGLTMSTSLMAQMTLEFNTNLSDGTSIAIPLYGTVNVTVDWGDSGSTDTYTTTGDKTHTYASEGTYTVSISGSLTQFGDGNAYNDADKLVKVTSFGNIGLISLEGAFYNTTNLEEVPITLPAAITDLSSTFRNTGKASITGLNSWDVSSVTSMAHMFNAASAFNQDISGWDVSSVSSIVSMFANASAFNQDINDWDVSNIVGLYSTFLNATSFNQPLNSWDVSNVTTMYRAFYGASAFNQPLNTWDVSSVSNMRSAFRSASKFNQDISSWDVSNVTNMYYMFYGASTFNQPLSTWDVSSVTTMYHMFRNASKFNQLLNSWDVSSTTEMSSMFKSASLFNQDISGWNVSNVTNMNYMFNGASKFNQDIGGWNVSSVTNMSGMFNNAVSFDKDIGGWDVSNVTSMDLMFIYVTLSTANYDALLIGWAALNLTNGVSFDGGNSTYSSGNAATARASIISDDSWIISDGGPAPYISWDGSSDSDWNTAENWSGNAVPLSTDNVVIPDVSKSTAPAPVIASDGTADCSSLTLNSGASLTLQSDANSTGSLIVEGTVTGDISIERHIVAWSGSSDGWHLLSSPVATFTINGSEFDPGDNDDLYRWEESTALWMNHKAGDPTQIVAGTGYLTAWEVTDTKSFSGTLNNSNITKTNLSYTESADQTGWHLLGNPFPSALLWDASAWSRTNVNGTAKIWNESGASYTDIAQNDPIPATQGFMIYVSSATNSITIPLADRSHNSQNW